MKILSITSPVTCGRRAMNTRIILLAVSVWVVGCNTATKPVVGQAKPSDANGQSQLTATAQLQTFRIYTQASIIKGNLSVADAGRLWGELTINLNENKVYWRGKELSYLRKQGRRLWFFAPGIQNTILISGNVDQDDKTVTLLFEDPHLVIVGGFTIMGRTKRGEGELLVETLGKLQFSEDTIGLVARTKYVDGNAVDMRAFEYAGKLKVDNSGCLLNDSAAIVFILQMPSGARSLVVSDGTRELVLWPNGNWLFYNIADVGLAVAGREEGLEAAYMKLRGLAKAPMPPDTEQDRKGRIPKKLLQDQQA